ncbi:Multidrug resistance protein NorM [compost metagenome]
MKKSDDFYKQMLKIAVPVTLQSLIMSLLNLTDQLMVGQLGDVAIASVGMSVKIYGILSVVLAGLATGVSIYASQFWGSGDRKSISQLLGLGLGAGLVLSGLFTIFVFFMPEMFLGIFTSDTAVKTEGSVFVQVFALSFIPAMLTMMYSAILRSTGHTKLPMYISLIAVGLNIVLNYGLIFGQLGMPEWGLMGAAAATAMARTVECLLIIGTVYKFRLPGADGFKQLFSVSKPLLRKFFATCYPIILTELIWVLGETAYAVVYSRMGTAEMTAMTITFPLQGLSIALLAGLASAAGIMVGQKLGAGDNDAAYDFARRLIRLGVMVSLVISVILAVISPLYVSAFNISDESHRLGMYLVWVFAGFLWVKVANMIQAGGVLNSGGDSKFVFVMESATTWIVGVPSALLLSFVFNQPIYWVYLILSLEEVVRFFVGAARIRSKKWMKNLVSDLSA